MHWSHLKAVRYLRLILILTIISKLHTPDAPRQPQTEMKTPSYFMDRSNFLVRSFPFKSFTLFCVYFIRKCWIVSQIKINHGLPENSSPIFILFCKIKFFLINLFIYKRFSLLSWYTIFHNPRRISNYCMTSQRLFFTTVLNFST